MIGLSNQGQKPNGTPVVVSAGLPEPGLPADLTAEIAERAQRLPSSFLYLVPTHRMARHFALGLLERNDVRGFVARPALALDDFIRESFLKLDGGLEPISEGLKLIIVESILADQQPGWRAFRAEDRDVFPGLVRCVCKGIQTLKQQQISADVYPRRARALRSAKYRELGRARELYDAFLASRQLADEDDMAQRLAAASEEELGRGPLAGIELLVLDGFYDFSPVQLQIVEKLAGLVPRVHVRFDYQPGRDRIFGPTGELVDRLRSLGAKVVERTSGLAEPFLSIGKQMFTTPSVARSRVPAEGRVGLVEGRTRAEEVEIIASELRRIQRAPNAPPLRRVLVTLAKEDVYAPLIREIFPRYGIHFNFSHGFGLHSSPVVATVLGMLAAVESRYHRDAVARFLSSPYVTFGPEEGRALKTVLDRECRAAGITDGREAWGSKLRERVSSLRRDLERIESGSSRPEEVPDQAAEAERLSRTITETETLTEAVLGALSGLSALEGEHPLAEFKELLIELIGRFGIERNIPKVDWRHVPLVEIEKNVRALTAFRGILDEIELAAGMRVQSAAHEKNAPRLTLSQFHTLLRAAVMGAPFPVSSHDDAGVQVMGIGETRGLRFDTVFVAGLVSGEFPRPIPENVFFSGDAARKVGLTDPERRVREQRCAMLRLLGTAERRLVLSRPLLNDKGDPAVRSPFLEELLDLIGDPVRIERGEGLFSRAGVSRWLGERLSQSAVEESGLVAGLLQADEALRHVPGQVLHSVRVEARRALRIFGEAEPDAGAWSGILKQAETGREIQRAFGPSHRFSVSQIEEYAQCPFAFFARYVLGLEELIVPEEEITPVTRGNVIHEALRAFYTERREHGKAAIRPEEAEEARRALAAAVQEAFAGLPFDDLFWRKALEAIVKPDGLAQAFIEAELEQCGRCEPRYFEFAFGRKAKMGTVDPSSVDEPLHLAEDVALAGKIDRVDLSPDGKAVVADYKVGSRYANQGAILAGLSFQLPLYLIAVRALLGVEPAAGQYFQVLRPSQCGRRTPIGDRESGKAGYFVSTGRDNLPSKAYDGTIEDLLDEVRENVLSHVAAIRAMRFPVTSFGPSEAGCANCAFHKICRRETGSG